MDDFVAASDEPESASASGPAEALPLDILDAVNADLKFAINRIVFKDIEANNFTASLTAGSGRFTLSDTALKLADGALTAELSGQKQGKALATEGKFAAKGVEAAQLIAMVSDLDLLEGAANTAIAFNSRGVTSDEIAANLSLTGSMDAPELVLKGIDIVDRFCGVLDTLEKVPQNSDDWRSLAMNQLEKRYGSSSTSPVTTPNDPAASLSASAAKTQRTQFKPIDMRFSLKGPAAEIGELKADLESIEARASGKFNTKSLDFRVPFTLQIADFAKGIERCVKIPDYVRRAKIPLVCRGNFASITPSTCVPDVSALRSDAKQYLAGAFEKEKAAVKAEAEAKIAAEKARLDARVAKEKAELEARKEQKKAELEAKLDAERKAAEEKAKDKVKDRLKGLLGG